MGLKILVLAKQVPDTRNVSKDAMKEDGTVNRAALPAIYNPEDLKALEQALRLKDKYADSKISVLTMGPSRAAEIIRESLYRGADDGFVLSDRAFAGSDTLATSYAISCAIRNFKDIDIIICGRQAIDGDTAQVGPQVAEKLGLPQITYAEEIISAEKSEILVKRRIEKGIEIVKSKMPIVITVNGSAADCRPRNAKRVMIYKHAMSESEKQQTENLKYENLYKQIPSLNITEWNVNNINNNAQCLGLNGSPTKVKSIENVIFQVKESKKINSSDNEIDNLMKELITNHSIG